MRENPGSARRAFDRGAVAAIEARSRSERLAAFFRRAHREVEQTANTVEWFHRLVGYPTAFLVAPVALLSFTAAGRHRRWGHAYFYLMIYLYLTGLFMTLARHPWGSWEFARNLLFNFYGFSLVLYGYRAIALLYGRNDPAPSALDRALAGALFVATAGLILLNWKHDTPMRGFAILGAVFSVLEVRDLRCSFRPREVLFARHLRFMLGSYFYVLTVLSIVHLQRLPRNVKWLWPAALAVPVVLVATSDLRFLTEKRSRNLAYAVGATLCTAATLGLYILAGAVRGDPKVFPPRPGMQTGFR